ncbi:glycosyltransferase [Kineosporia babensis]|uniref:Glycosyltransferase n=1 Tax=Kineosporia babensis TaxID=499548 RepID=A0A9X1SYV6_9ACTN|nr:glycosyltransferase [Kineosporia babensis]MCD5316735.1 glycosyltransferase [Kineosporia babensis]
MAGIAELPKSLTPTATPTAIRRATAIPAAPLDLIIPVLNEELRIGRTLAALAEHIDLAGHPVRLIVVDNGSVDATVSVVERDCRGLDVEVISCRHRGKGAAVRTGMLHSRAPRVGFCDADLSTPLSTFGTALELLDAGCPAVIASRRVAGASYAVRQPMVRRAGSQAFGRIAAPLVGPIRDTQCGFKLFDGDLAREVFADMQLNGFAFDVELIARLLRRGVEVAEVAVAWTDDADSTFSPMRDGYAAFRDLMLIKRALRHA